MRPFLLNLILRAFFYAFDFTYIIQFSKINMHFSTCENMLVFLLVEPRGFEPLTSCVQGRRSPS